MNTPDQGLPPTRDGQTFPPDPAAPAAPKDRDDASDLLKAMLMAAVIALTIRSLLFEPFNIPSGSMFPSLLVGDYLFVEKYSYGYSKYSFPLDLAPISGRIFEKSPKRGDIAVFRQPKRVHIDYIKRIVGLPGDTVQMREGVLYLNGEAVPREYLGVEDLPEGNAINVYQKYIETLPEDKAGAGRRHFIYEVTDDEVNDNTQIFTVPEGYYFAMGDNRDSSLDSRVQDQVGFVPAENLVGRAAFIFFSTAGVGDACAREGKLAALRSAGCYLFKWPQAIRYERLFRPVHGL